MSDPGKICYRKGSEEPAGLQPGLLRLYNMPFCPSAYRVRMVLAVKGVTYEVVNIDLSSKPDWFLTKNPEGLVPALELNGHILTESMVLSDFINSAYGSNQENATGDNLWSDDPLERAKEKLLIERASKLGDLNSKIYGRKNISGFDEFLDELKYYEDRLNSKGTPYFSGRLQQPGMVDYMIWPFFKTASILFTLGLYQGQGALESAERPALTAWMKRMRNHRVCQHNYPDDEISAQFWRSLAVDSKPQFHLGLQRLPPITPADQL